MTAKITEGFDKELETCSRPNKEQLNTPRTRNGIMEEVRWQEFRQTKTGWKVNETYLAAQENAEGHDKRLSVKRRTFENRIGQVTNNWN